MTFRFPLVLLCATGCSTASVEPSDASAPDAEDLSPVDALPPVDADTLVNPDHCFVTQGEAFEVRSLNNNVAEDHGGVAALAVAPSAQVAVASTDGNIKLWDTPAGYGLLDPEAGGGEPVAALAFDPNERWVAAAGSNGSVFLWDVVGRLAGASASVGGDLRAIAVSSDGEQVLVINDAASAHTRVWSVETDVLGDARSSAVDDAFAAVFLPESAQYAIAGSTGDLASVAIHSADGSILGSADLASVTAPVSAMALSYDGAQLVVGGDGFVATIAWQGVTSESTLAAGDEGYELHVVEGHAVTALKVSSTGEHFATLGAEGTLRVWELATLIEVARTTVTGAAALDAMPEGERFVVGGSDGYIRFYGCE